VAVHAVQDAWAHGDVTWAEHGRHIWDWRWWLPERRLGGHNPDLPSEGNRFASGATRVGRAISETRAVIRRYLQRVSKPRAIVSITESVFGGWILAAPAIGAAALLNALLCAPQAFLRSKGRERAAFTAMCVTVLLESLVLHSGVWPMADQPSCVPVVGQRRIGVRSAVCRPKRLRSR